MSLGPRTVVDVGMWRVGAASKVGYMSESDGATPLCHEGTFSGAYPDCRCSLLNSLHTRRCKPLKEWLEWHGGLFLDLVSTLFFGGDRLGNEELPEENLSSAVALLSPGRMGSLPLFCLTGGAGWLCPRAFSP